MCNPFLNLDYSIPLLSKDFSLTISIISSFSAMANYLFLWEKLFSCISKFFHKVSLVAWSCIPAQLSKGKFLHCLLGQPRVCKAAEAHKSGSSGQSYKGKVNDNSWPSLKIFCQSAPSFFWLLIWYLLATQTALTTTALTSGSHKNLLPASSVGARLKGI